MSRGLLAPALVAAAACSLTAAPQVPQPRPDAGAPFYAIVQSDRRHDGPGLGTVIVAGATRLLVDAGVPDGAGVDARHLDTLLVTGLDRLTPSRLAPLLVARRGSAAGALQISGPAGTANLVQRSAAGLYARGTTTRAAAMADVHDAIFDAGGGVTVRAVPMTSGRVAYVVRFDGRAMLVATDVAESCSLVNLGEPIDLAVVRHTPESAAAHVLAAVGAARAVLAQDGMPGNISGIRAVYRGPVEFARAGATRVLVPRRAVEAQAERLARERQRPSAICS